MRNSNQMERELFEKANVSIDTPMCVEESADDKALKDTMLEEVQITKLLVYNLSLSGGDINREPPLAYAILRMTHQEHGEDWEVVAELPTPKKLFFLKFYVMKQIDPFQTCREYSSNYQHIVKFAVIIVLVEDVEQLIFLH